MRNYDADRLNELGSLIEQKKRQRSELEEHIQSANEHHKRIVGEYEHMVSELPSMRSEKELLKSEVSSLLEQIELSQERLSFLVAQIKPHKDLGEDIKTLKQDKEILERDIRSLEDAEGVLKQSVETLTMSERTKRGVVTELSDTILRSYSDIEKFSSDKKKVDERIAYLEEKERSVKGLVEKNEKAIEELERFPHTIGYYTNHLQRHFTDKGIKIDVLAVLKSFNS